MQGGRPVPNRRILAGLMIALFALAAFLPSLQGRMFASAFMNFVGQSRNSAPTQTLSPAATSPTAPPVVSFSTEISGSPTDALPLLTPRPASSPTVTSTSTLTITPTPTPSPTDSHPATYVLQKGEYPYCIARRFNVDPAELLSLNGMQNRQTFFAGTVLQIPQTGKPFPGQRMQQIHPATYTVSVSNETLYTIACAFGDVHPLAIAKANNLPLDSVLSIGQQLTIP